MPHVDELLGPATFAAAGLFAAIALQAPAAGGAPAPATASAATTAAPVRAPDVVSLGSIEVVARRSSTLAHSASDARASGAGKPRA